MTTQTRAIRKAVFPIAGLGTRFLPITKSSPKEMLSIVDKPLIQYAVEEAYAAGIKQMIFITGRSKRSIEDYFDVAYELEAELEKACEHQLLSIVRSIKPDDMECIYIRQPRALGLGHAILCSESVVGAEPFAVILADDLLQSDSNILSDMIEVYSQVQSSVLLTEQVCRSKTSHYGIVSGTRVQDSLLNVTAIIEKPNPQQAPSTIAVIGRYILTPTIFNLIKRQTVNHGREIQLTDAISELLALEKVYAFGFNGVRYDCGSKLGLVQAITEFGKRHHEIGKEFSHWLSNQKTIINMESDITSTV